MTADRHYRGSDYSFAADWTAFAVALPAVVATTYSAAVRDSTLLKATAPATHIGVAAVVAVAPSVGSGVDK